MNKLTENRILKFKKYLNKASKSLNTIIDEVSPNVLTFLASDDNISRIKLYQKFSKDIINENNEYYDFYHKYENIPIFVICKYSFNILKIKNL